MIIYLLVAFFSFSSSSSSLNVVCTNEMRVYVYFSFVLS